MRDVSSGHAPCELLLLAAVGLCAAAGLAGIASVPAALGMAACWAAVIGGAGIAARRWGNGRDLGAADRITLARAFATSISAAAAVVAPDLSDPMLWGIGILAAITLIFDGIDGHVARRSGRSSEFGARLDQEVDAFTVLVLSLLVWRLGRADLWVLGAGVMRYAFVSAGSVWPWLREPLPASLRRRVVCVVQVAVLVACIPPMLPAPIQVSLLVAGLAALTASFARDVLLLRTAGRKRRAGDAEGAAGSACSGP